ncbi:hypothetical protein [Desulfitobacterium hafniense]|uniref:Uncharacterized protein n=4 Tax=root TaxID=1 RepID=Q251J1_DESHY|nr:hypothetical protein [Desulfitobacterium hafniense]EHL09058.1 hypothetical protein HMPREF0322_00244 [Desulfitobacterium hafniense DP7]KTE92333.1 hypothetical protein AT727_20095 [Desulfitobacterium hafniense]MEA5024416.1 hypothetical protein [Desulfitobacterium hafniense]BAE82051.1 hypothetical protein DSY0262 [Desulfitobacterium hafniense Y51]
MDFVRKLFKGNLNLIGRIMFGAAGLILLASLFLPWWHLDLVAPQYPEGLSVIVYPDKLDGRIDIINNINHYIGMKWISEEDFPEFQVITKVAYVIIGLALITALVKKRWLAWLTAGLGAVGGMIGVYDLWRWLRDYGTQLDPMAAIKIDPFTPPIIGTNKLANFITYTGFNSGGYLLGLSIILMLLAAWRFKEHEKQEE